MAQVERVTGDSDVARVRLPRTRRGGMSRGVVLGLIAALALVTVVWGVRHVVTSGPETYAARCDGARVTGTIWIDGSIVFTSVAVVDPSGRRWDVAWGAYAEEIAGSSMTPVSRADYDGSFLTTAQALGDTDDGTHRTAQVRPQGQQAWCDLDMHVSWLW